MPKAFSEQERQQISQRLLEEGRKHFAVYGLRKTSVEQLAAAAGISKGAFYHFYESKESFFMEVVEDAERLFRQELFLSLAQPGPSAQLRLYRVFHKAFTLWKEIPILQIFTHTDYELLARRVPPETLQTHLESDRDFAAQLIERCHLEGIHIAVQPGQLGGLLHTLFFVSLHEDDFGVGKLTEAIELQIQLTAAYCVGDVVLLDRKTKTEVHNKAIGK